MDASWISQVYTDNPPAARHGYKGGAMGAIAPLLIDFFLKKINKNK